MEKILKPALFGLKALLIVVGIILTYLTVSSFQSEWGAIKKTEVFFSGETYESFMGYLGGTTSFSMVLIYIAIGIILIFGIYGMVTNIKKAIPFLIGAVVLVVIWFIAYKGMSSDFIDPSWEAEGVTPEISKRSEGGIKAVFILLILTVAGIVYGEVSKLFK